MADPVSIIASIITLVSSANGIARGTEKIIRAWRNATDELLALSNEVNDFQAILVEVQNTFMLSQGDGEGIEAPGTNASLARLIGQVEEQMEAFESFVRPLAATVEQGKLDTLHRISLPRRFTKSRKLRQGLSESVTKLDRLLVARGV